MPVSGMHLARLGHRDQHRLTGHELAVSEFGRTDLGIQLRPGQLDRLSEDPHRHDTTLSNVCIASLLNSSDLYILCLRRSPATAKTQPVVATGVKQRASTSVR